MELSEFKKLRRHYGAFPALRIYICQNADVDVFCADSHLGRLIDEHPLGKVERFTSKKLFEIAEGIVNTIQEHQKQMLVQVEQRHKHFIQKVFAKN